MSDNKTYPSKNQSQILKEIKLRDVKNLHELPFFLASTNPKKGAVRIELDPSTHPEGGTLERVMNISPVSVESRAGLITYSYPDMKTQEYTSWLFHIWQQMAESDFRKGFVYWTRYEIHKLMGKSNGGKECKIHDDHFERLVGTSYGIDDSFYNKTDNKHIKQLRRFSILSSLNLTEMREGETVMLERCSAVINPLLVENFLKNYTKPLNLSVFSSIPSKAGIARKLYLKLDLQFGGDLNRFEMTTERFFRENGIIGSKYKKPSARKQNLEKAIKQLLGKKFSSDKTIQGYKFTKTADGKDWKVIIWAHQWKVLSLPNFENQQVNRKQKPAKSLEEKPAIEIVKTEPQNSGLRPIGEVVHNNMSPESIPTHSTTTDNVTLFLNKFVTLFTHADTENIHRSRSIKDKSQTFIDQHGIKRALDFLDYAKAQSNQTKGSKLFQAETPIYLFKSKLAGGLINSWIEERKAELTRKQVAVEQVKKQREEEKIAFTNSKLSDYDDSLSSSVEAFSELQKEHFNSYFQKQEQQHLAGKNQFYIDRYQSNSALLKMPLWRQAVVEFSRELTPTPLPTFEEYLRENYGNELRYYETGEGEKPQLN